MISIPDKKHYKAVNDEIMKSHMFMVLPLKDIQAMKTEYIILSGYADFDESAFFKKWNNKAKGKRND